MEEKLLTIKNNAISLILETKSLQELEEIRIHFLGRNGEVTQLLKELPNIPKEDRPKVGGLSNEVKRIIEDTIESREAALKKTKVQNFPHIDVTEPGIRPPLGHLHLITQAIREITTIFTQIGFTRVRYPEIEWDWYAFTALNFPENHPARDDWETFFIKHNPDPKKGRMLLTPHTSSGQIREMQKGKLPIKMLNIAKTYRRQSDVSHTPIFHQFETLVVGEKISIADLKGTLDYFVKSYFGEDRKSRIRPYHFQFTEPSFETDVSCGVCNGKGCKLCKEGWLELGGAGMVHPNVLRNCGLDPEKYTGFASGWGVERVLMMKDGIKIDDLRILYSNDLDFLKQF
jgi:phenylalanyl-tRNA synthetase alpha chain